MIRQIELKIILRNTITTAYDIAGDTTFLEDFGVLVPRREENKT